jgi:hypothetical protein
MREKEKSIGMRKVEDKEILVANKPCDKLYDTLGNIKFRL